MARRIDLNADMGEYSDDKSAVLETALMKWVTSCSVACGGHTGNAETMLRTILLAKSFKTTIGAHPSYPDKEGFGRRSLNIDGEALAQSLRKQIGALADLLQRWEYSPPAHVKPHGALYNDAAKDDRLAALFVSATSAVSNTAIMGPPNSALQTATENAGLRFIAEGFVDRLYRADGSLTPRSQEGAVIEDNDARIAQAIAIAKREPVAAADGVLTLSAQTLCIHSDSDNAHISAKSLRKALKKAHIDVVRHDAII